MDRHVLQMLKFQFKADAKAAKLLTSFHATGHFWTRVALIAFCVKQDVNFTWPSCLGFKNLNINL